MAKVFNINQVTQYKLKAEEESPDASVFNIGALDAQLEAYLLDQVKEKNFTRSFEIVRFGLKGWENFEAKFETEKVFTGVGERTAVTLASMSCIKPYLSELALAIITQQKLTVTDQKN